MRLKRIGILTLFIIVPLFAQDWAGLQNTLIKFYRYQRSGLAPTTANPTGNPYNPFYTTTGTGNDANHYPHWSDGGSTPLDGGFYDAGDFMKFGLPLGFSVYCLLKGYDVFTDPACYDDLNSWNALGTKDNIPDILNEAKVGTDYIIKAVISSTQIVQTVGNGPTDHGALTESGYANSLRTEPRPVSYCAGGDVPGFYAAALALMSILYKSYDATYSATCLSKAQLAYTFAVAHPSICVEQTDPSTGAPFYVSATYQDKLACAAIELYRATKTASYLTAAKTYFSTVSQPHYDVLGYAHCSDLAAFELYRSGDSTSKSSAEGSLLANVSTELSRVVKMGTAYVGGATVNTTNWGTCRTVGNAAFTAAMLYMIDGDVGLKNFVIQQVQWLAGLGSFTRSWITQYGTTFPQNPHSRNDINLRQFARLTGGVVSGPTSDNCTGADKSTCSWSFTDDNSIYKNTECALDYGCGAIGAVAFIRWANKTTDTIRIDSALAPTPAKLDLTSQTETITATLSQSTSWTVILKGQTSKATKTYTGTGTKVLIQNWKGDIDAGSNAFTAERVSVYFDTTKMKIWNVQKSTSGSTYFDIVNLQVTAWGAKDIAVDDFEDTALMTNLLGGKWSGFCDLSDGISGGESSAPVIFSDSGRNSAKGLYFTLSRNAGATAEGAPYAGIKTTFTALGAPVNLGSADTIMFDLKPLGTNSVLCVQLEQSDITDGAYFGSSLLLGSAGNWVRLYVPIASLAQPAWKTAAKALNLKKAVSVRFVGYGVGSDRYVIDNLRISNLSVTAGVLRAQSKPSAARSLNPVEFYSVSPTALTYGIFFKGIEGAVIAADLFDCLGKSVFSYKINGYKTGAAITVNGFTLHAGIYFLKHTVAGTNKSVIVPFMVTK